MKSKSILMVGSYADSLVKFRGELLQAFVSEGMVVHVCAPNIFQNTNAMERFNAMGISVHSVPLSRTGLNPIEDFLYFMRLARLFRRINPDFVFLYTVKPVVYGSLAARLVGVSSICTLITGLGYGFTDGNTSLARRVTSYIVPLMYRIALARCDIVFFQNLDDRALFYKKRLINSRQLVRVVRGSGVDLSHYSVVELPEAPRFLMIARLLGDKGVREYVSAAKKIKRRYPDVEFALVGWIDSNPDAILQSELDYWIDEGIVSYLGRLDDVREAISNSNVYVLPSYREGMPRTVLEAMSMGRAIITTNVPGCRETVIDGSNGILVEPKSVDSISQAMLYLIEHPSRIREMGRKSRKFVEHSFDVNNVNRDIINGLRSVN